MNKHYRERFHVDAVTAAKDLQELGVNYAQAVSYTHLFPLPTHQAEKQDGAVAHPLKKEDRSKSHKRALQLRSFSLSYNGTCRGALRFCNRRAQSSGTASCRLSSS